MNTIKSIYCTIIFFTLCLFLNSCSIVNFGNNQSENLDIKIKKLIDQGRYEQAVELMNKAIFDENVDLRTLINIAWIYAFDKKYEKAILVSDQIIKKHPGCQEVYYLKGYVYQKNENYNSAIKSYKKAIELEPIDVKSFSAIAEVYQILEDYKNSIYYYKQAIKLDPKNYVYHLDLANVYFKISYFNESLKEAQKAHKFAPKSDKEKISEILENIKLNAILSHDKNGYNSKENK